MKRLFFGTKSYQWFELLMVAALTLMVSISVVLTMIHAGYELFHVISGGIQNFSHDQFVTVFGAFMTVLIALEFNHTVLPEISSGTPVVKVRAVILVALLALARKLVLVDYHKEDYTSLIALAVLVVAATFAYWVVRRDDEETARGSGTSE
ncbi:MAG: phosphate-starvation-inducible PsiE family protein [Deltaproteobacteria bacterium]|nr:phosphate-starvation-inducible PsiE family protein [Deltaproteobacteria bacterium]